MSSRREMVITGTALSSAGFLQWLGPRWDAGAAFWAERKLSTLAAGLHVTYFESVLGPFARRRRATPGKDGSALEEWVWLDRRFFLQAVTDPGGTVLRWAVTSRSYMFIPEFDGAVVLNRTPFVSVAFSNLCGIRAQHRDCASESYAEEWTISGNTWDATIMVGLNLVGLVPDIASAGRVSDIGDILGETADNARLGSARCPPHHPERSGDPGPPGDMLPPHLRRSVDGVAR